MTATLEQLRTSYEDLGMSLDEIVQDNPDLSLESIKSGLVNCSSKYRKDCGVEERSGNEDRLNFTDDDMMRVNDVIRDLALGAEDEHLRYKAATYIRDDKKGRKEVAALLKGNQFNIFQFNAAIKGIRGTANNIKSTLLGNDNKTINV